MKWKKFTLNTTTAAVDLVSSLLDELGIEGIEVEDHVPLTEAETKGMFIDILPDPGPDDGTAKVSFYLDDEKLEGLEELLRQIEEGLDDLSEFVDVGERTIQVSETEDKDWINNWKQYFSSFTVGNLYIKPTWEETEEIHRDKLMIEIDPGVSFGTGKHETTQLCLLQMQKYLKKGDLLLDVGCGSGILSIAALKMGAAHVTGTDIDPDCIGSTRENMETNRLDLSLGDFYVGNLTTDRDLQETVGIERYDVVVANILADIIIPMATAIAAAMKPGAVFIASGIIDFKTPEVKRAIKSAGLRILEENTMGEWASITAEKE